MKNQRIWMMIIASIIGMCLMQFQTDASLAPIGLTYKGTSSNDFLGKAMEKIDVDGDSVWEIVIMDNSTVKVYEYDSAQQTFNTSVLTTTGSTPSLDDLTVGDFNGDGYEDLIVSEIDSDAPTIPPTTNVGRIDVYLSSGSSLILTDTLYGPYSAGNPPSISDFGYSMDSGDFDADGFDDLIIGAPWWPGTSGDVGQAYIYWGFNADPDPNYGMTNSDSNCNWRDLFFSTGSLNSIKIIDPFQSDFNDIGWCVRNLGDVNANVDDDVVHYDDFAITDYDDDNNWHNFGIGVYYGNSRGSISSTPDDYLGSFGTHYAAADVDSGDINGDGYSDLITGSLPDVTDTPVGTSVHIFPGSSNGLSGNNVYSHPAAGDETYSDYPTFDIACLGDENNDGMYDIMMSRPNNNSQGIVYCWDGLSNLTYLSFADWNLTGGQNGQLLGYSRIHAGKAICGMPDMDSNGNDEAFIGSPNWDNSTSQKQSGKAEYFR